MDKIPYFAMMPTQKSICFSLKSTSASSTTMRGTKRSRSELLMDYQIEYFKGQVERQHLERELLEVKLRIMKKAEQKLDEWHAAELLRLISEE